MPVGHTACTCTVAPLLIYLHYCFLCVPKQMLAQDGCGRLRLPARHAERNHHVR